MSENLAALPEFEQIIPKTEADEACFEDIRQVLQKHGALSRFGICLLHQHFPLDGDEVLIEHVDADARTMTIRPLRKSEIGDNVLETVWRLDIQNPTQRCVSGCEWDTDEDGKKSHRKTHKYGG
jgi:hypothetical protein